MSTFQCPGPRNMFFPVLPKVPTAGLANSESFSQGMQAWLPVHGVREAAGAVPPYWLALPTKSARSAPRLVLERSVPARIVKGFPDVAVQTPDHCHPPRAHFVKEFLPAICGRSHTNDATRRCVWSKSEGPVSKAPCAGSPYGRPEPLLDPTSVMPPLFAKAMSIALE